MMITGQNIKNSGTSGGAGGQSLTSGGTFIWETGRDYVFKLEIVNGVINHYVCDINGNILACKTGVELNRGHSNTDIIYAAIGGTKTTEAIWSSVKIEINGNDCTIDSVTVKNALLFLTFFNSKILLRKNTMTSCTTPPLPAAVRLPLFPLPIPPKSPKSEG